MISIIKSALFQVLLTTLASCHLYNPYSTFFKYNYPQYYSPYTSSYPYNPYVPTYSEPILEDTSLPSYPPIQQDFPTLNVLAEIPFSVGNSFTVVPMVVVAKDNMKMVSNAHIMEVSQKKPEMKVMTEKNELVKCTPAVKIVLDQPIIVQSLKTSIVFPREFLINHGDYKIPINVGAVVVPIRSDVFVSAENPVKVDVVYAVPTTPVNPEYVNENDIIVSPEDQSVIVNSDADAPAKNITVLQFPENVASPVLSVDDEDDELVNRNPPQVLAPGGIVQSTQPHTVVEAFHNSKESPVLSDLREDSKKRV